MILNSHLWQRRRWFGRPRLRAGDRETFHSIRQIPFQVPSQAWLFASTILAGQTTVGRNVAMIGATNAPSGGAVLHEFWPSLRFAHFTVRRESHNFSVLVATRLKKASADGKRLHSNSCNKKNSLMGVLRANRNALLAVAHDSGQAF